MTLKELKEHFSVELSSVYNHHESESIFFLAIEDVFNIKRTDYLLKKDEEVNRPKIEIINLILSNLKNNKPIQYILGYEYCNDLKFYVNEHTLIPRQETEYLISLIINKNKNKEKLNILDIGTGTACIAINLKKYLKNSNVQACDISDKALKTADKNARLNKTEINFYKLDIIKNQNETFNKSFDIIVSNPPYVTEEQKKEMHKNVIDYEPHTALFVPDSAPLKYYEAITNFAMINLKTGGQLWFEINEKFGKEIKSMLEQNCFSGVEIIKDLNNKDRIVFAYKAE